MAQAAPAAADSGWSGEEIGTFVVVLLLLCLVFFLSWRIFGEGNEEVDIEGSSPA